MSEEHISYVAYMGRREVNGKVVKTWCEVSEEGARLTGETFAYASKFPYAKSPRIGGIYKIFHTDETRKRYYVKEYHEVWHQAMPDKDLIRQWQLQDESAMTVEEMQKAAKKEAPGDEIGGYTLDQLRDLLRSKPRRQRVAMLALVLEYLK